MTAGDARPSLAPGRTTTTITTLDERDADPHRGRMSLTAGCVRCSAPVVEAEGYWSCPEHGATARLWRAEEASYDAFAEHLLTAGSFPTYVPWPLSPGWAITD